MSELIAVGCGGFIGAIARYAASSGLNRLHGAPLFLGTLTVNMLGCFCIGLMLAFVESRANLSPQIRLFAVVGLLGSLTTFSTFAYEATTLLRSGAIKLAITYVVVSAVLGLLFVVVGRASWRILSS